MGHGQHAEATPGRDDRALQHVGQPLQGVLPPRRVDAGAGEQDRTLRAREQIGRRLDGVGVRLLAHQAVALGGGRRPQVDGAVDVVLGKLHVDRAGCARHGLAEGLVEHLVHLLGELDHPHVLHGRLEEARLGGVLELAAAHLGVEHAGALAGQEEHRDVLLGGADGGGRQVRHAGALIADDHLNLARHARERVGHEGPGRLVVGGDHLPAPIGGGPVHAHEARVGDAEERAHALRLEKVEDALGNVGDGLGHDDSRARPPARGRADSD
jgi:hypothetical protein